MKGLLWKDFYMTLKYCRAFLLIILVFLAVSAMNEESVFFIVYPVVLVSMIPVTLLAYDERSKWDVYCQCLPYTKGQFVSGKYMVSLIGTGVVWVLSVLVRGVSLMGAGRPLIESLVSFSLILLSLGLLAPSIVLPIILKFGSEKGRIAYYLIIIVVCAMGTALNSLQKELQFTFFMKLSPMSILLIGLAVFICSWLLSIRLYQSREL